ncbi:hypothetical protein L596_021651 [Steinernema carpocapsae]|uniref:BESS domain-containing protein n=1 Tax=Steinernema carpocapsae TaxID=34508 RepID=A0A4U5MJD0_STECR|nr:hypothetical protein L596_021651 [Steinernema carpocapsae]
MKHERSKPDATPTEDEILSRIPQVYTPTPSNSPLGDDMEHLIYHQQILEGMNRVVAPSECKYDCCRERCQKQKSARKQLFFDDDFELRPPETREEDASREAVERFQEPSAKVVVFPSDEAVRDRQELQNAEVVVFPPDDALLYDSSIYGAPVDHAPPEAVPEPHELQDDPSAQVVVFPPDDALLYDSSIYGAPVNHAPPEAVPKPQELPGESPIHDISTYELALRTPLPIDALQPLEPQNEAFNGPRNEENQLPQVARKFFLRRVIPAVSNFPPELQLRIIDIACKLTVDEDSKR